MTRTALLTGAAGFIGSHVADALLARGDRVVGYDNLDNFYDPARKRQNVAGLCLHPRFSFVEGDIRNSDLLQKTLADQPCDLVIHLAARPGVRPSIEQPALYADVNIAGTSKVLEAARAANIRDVVFASSSSVYGERKDIPFRETDNVDHPVSPYAATKKAGELLAYTYHHLYDLNIACLRFFTVYGPRQRPEMAIHKFAELISSGRSVPMYGDGSTRRDYTYISDIVAGVLGAVDKHRGYCIYNLGNHQMVSLAELIEIIGQTIGRRPVIDRRPLQPGDVSTTCADIQLASDRLGYHPATPIAQGIRLFIDWFQAQHVRA
ncbi:MAG: NAD-dependent epimerase/dehydratase family protein [Planctomycetota bacterium]